MYSRGRDIYARDIITVTAMMSDLHTALVDMYGKCGDLPSAVAVFEAIPESQRNMVSINVMMGAYCSNRGNAECIELFKRTLQQNVLRPTLTSYQIVLRCCTNGTSFYFGRQIHDRLRDNHGCDGGTCGIVGI